MSQCTAQVTKKNGSKGQCSRAAKIGALCTQHAKMTLPKDERPVSEARKGKIALAQATQKQAKIAIANPNEWKQRYAKPLGRPDGEDEDEPYTYESNPAMNWRRNDQGVKIPMNGGGAKWCCKKHQMLAMQAKRR